MLKQLGTTALLLQLLRLQRKQEKSLEKIATTLDLYLKLQLLQTGNSLSELQDASTESAEESPVYLFDQTQRELEEIKAAEAAYIAKFNYAPPPHYDLDMIVQDLEEK
jgi:hypothetical protein